jgi:hypothetical protein
VVGFGRVGDLVLGLFLALGFWSWRARKGEVRRHSVLTDVVVLSYLQDVLVWERCWMVNAVCEWIHYDTRVSDHFQIW